MVTRLPCLGLTSVWFSATSPRPRENCLTTAVQYIDNAVRIPNPIHISTVCIYTQSSFYSLLCPASVLAKCTCKICFTSSAQSSDSVAISLMLSADSEIHMCTRLSHCGDSFYRKQNILKSNKNQFTATNTVQFYNSSCNTLCNYT